MVTVQTNENSEKTTAKMIKYVFYVLISVYAPFKKPPLTQTPTDIRVTIALLFSGVCLSMDRCVRVQVICMFRFVYDTQHFQNMHF